MGIGLIIYGFTLNQEGVVEEWLNSKAKSATRITSALSFNR